MDKLNIRDAVLLVVAGLGSAAAADDWPQWLGPHRDGVWREQGIIDRFPDDGPPLRWSVKIGGGYSGPSVADGRVFLMDRVNSPADLASGEFLNKAENPLNDNFVRRLLPGKERIVCLDETDGRVLWTHEYDCPYTTVAVYAIGPRVTPTVDGDRVYTLGAEGHLICLDVDNGQVIWQKHLVREYGVAVPEWGFAGHPLIDGDNLICLVGGEGTTAMAFDKRTGREIWRSLSTLKPGYCPPMIYEIGGERQLIIWHGESINGLDPQTGRVYWSVPFEATFAMSIATPRLIGQRLFIMSFNRLSALIEVGADGRSAQVVWRGSTRRGVGGVFNTAWIEGGYAYACGQNGRYTCIELATGDRVWTSYEPSTGDRPASWANVFTIKHNDRYFLFNDLGAAIIARLSPDGYEQVSRAQLIEPTHEVGGRRVVWSHPALANGCVFVRNDVALRCFDLKKKN